MEITKVYIAYRKSSVKDGLVSGSNDRESLPPSKFSPLVRPCQTHV